MLGFDEADQDAFVEGLRREIGSVVLFDCWRDDAYLRELRRAKVGTYRRIYDRKASYYGIVFAPPQWKPVFERQPGDRIVFLQNPVYPIGYWMRWWGGLSFGIARDHPDAPPWLRDGLHCDTLEFYWPKVDVEARRVVNRVFALVRRLSTKELWEVDARGRESPVEVNKGRVVLGHGCAEFLRQRPGGIATRIGSGGAGYRPFDSIGDYGPIVRDEPTKAEGDRPEK